MVISFTNQQLDYLSSSRKQFIAYTGTDRFRQDQQDWLRRAAYFAKELPARLADLSEADVSDLVGSLYASQMWGNKQYLVQKVIADNGLDKLREELQHLLDHTVAPGNRYEQWLQRVRRLGPASVTEMLCYSDPEHCGIWNQKAREAVKRLGLSSVVPPEKYRLSGREYERFNELLEAIGEQLRASGVGDVDLLMVNSFLYEVSEGKPPDVKPPVTVQQFDHDEVRDLIESIGAMLGFDAQTEVKVAPGAAVDVVWRARIGNLGTVSYVFEVHKSGSIDSLLLNLQKAKGGPTVQKVIAVSDEAQLKKIEKETEGLPEEFRRSMAFWPVGEVNKAGESLRVASDIINRLDLTP